MGQPDGLASLARELVALAPPVIACVGRRETAALQAATRTIPIVFIQVNDPVEQGFVASLARPGGNTRRKAWSSSLPNSFKPNQVPSASAGSPIRNSHSVSAPIILAPPSQAAVIANTATRGAERPRVAPGATSPCAAPDNCGEAGRPGGAAQDAIDDPDRAVAEAAGARSSRAAAAQGCKGEQHEGSRQPRCAAPWRGPAQQLDAKRHTDCVAGCCG
jgi:ABC transporter substrate binding protein